jgi:hypothetical protein
MSHKLVYMNEVREYNRKSVGSYPNIRNFRLTSDNFFYTQTELICKKYHFPATTDNMSTAAGNDTKFDENLTFVILLVSLFVYYSPPSGTFLRYFLFRGFYPRLFTFSSFGTVSGILKYRQANSCCYTQTELICEKYQFKQIDSGRDLIAIYFRLSITRQPAGLSVFFISFFLL